MSRAMSAKPAPNLPPAEQKPEGSGWRARWHEIIFEADTPAGKRFDVALLGIILLSVLAVSLESVREMRRDYDPVLQVLREPVVNAVARVIR